MLPILPFCAMPSVGTPTDSNRAADQSITLRAARSWRLNETDLVSKAKQCVPMVAGWLANDCRWFGVALPLNVIVFTVVRVRASFLTMDTADLDETCRKSALNGVSAPIQEDGNGRKKQQALHDTNFH